MPAIAYNVTYVPANATLGTSQFCVAQYEMKVTQNSGTELSSLVSSISLSGARTARILTRGGNFSNPNSPGIFAGDLDGTSTGTSTNMGFRCVKSL